MKCSRCGADTSHELSAQHLCIVCRNEARAQEEKASKFAGVLVLGGVGFLLLFSIYFTILLVQALQKYLAS